MVRVLTIAEVSPASSRAKNFEREIAARLERAGWSVVYHNISVARVQIDLLARSPQGVLTLVEVKMPSVLRRLSVRQRQRLMRAAAVLAEFEPVEMCLASVRGGELELIPVDGLTA